MKHKVTCMDCGNVGIIEVEKGNPVPKGWYYYGKLDILACVRSKYWYEAKSSEDIKKLFGKDAVKIKNPKYKPGTKPKYVELWVCEKCENNFMKGDKNGEL